MLTAAELIKELQKVPPNTQIRVYADLGQCCMQASTWGLQYIHKSDKNEYMADTVSVEDITDCRALELIQIYEIGAP